MSFLDRINSLSVGDMTVEFSKIGCELPEPMFIIKDSDFPKHTIKIESGLLFFIAEFNDKYIPFLYYAVRFNGSDRFIYDAIIFIDKVEMLEKLLLGKRQYRFIGSDKLSLDKTSYFNAILLETVNNAINKEISKTLGLFKKTKDSNKGAMEDFVELHKTNAFWNFIGDKSKALDRIRELSKNGLIVDLVVSKTNTISEPEPRGCMSNTLIGGSNN